MVLSKNTYTWGGTGKLLLCSAFLWIISCWFFRQKALTVQTHKLDRQQIYCICDFLHSQLQLLMKTVLIRLHLTMNQIRGWRVNYILGPSAYTWISLLASALSEQYHKLLDCGQTFLFFIISYRHWSPMNLLYSKSIRKYVPTVFT